MFNQPIRNTLHNSNSHEFEVINILKLLFVELI